MTVNSTKHFNCIICGKIENSHTNLSKPLFKNLVFEKG